MAKNKSRMGSIVKRSLAFVLGALGLMSTAQSSNYIPGNNVQSVRSKDAINNLPAAPKPQRENKKQSGGGNPYKYHKKGNMNQKQYRKHCKSNPHLYKSKKHRSKN